MKKSSQVFAALTVCIVSGCSTSTPYATRHCFKDRRLFHPDDFIEVAAVPHWRDRMEKQRKEGNYVMVHQTSSRTCVDEVLRSLDSWCIKEWSAPLEALPSGTGKVTDSWRDPYEQTRDGYVPKDVVLDYVNRVLAPRWTNDFRIKSVTNDTWKSFCAELGKGRPVIVPYMLSPIPWHGRVTGRLMLALTYPVDRLVYWVSLSGGPGWSIHRECFLSGEDDIHQHYLHGAIIVGLFKRKHDGKEFVLLLDPWGGDWLVFSKNSNIFEVLPREEFERRWRNWSAMQIPDKILAKWLRMAHPGTMLVFE